MFLFIRLCKYINLYEKSVCIVNNIYVVSCPYHYTAGCGEWEGLRQ